MAFTFRYTRTKSCQALICYAYDYPFELRVDSVGAAFLASLNVTPTSRPEIDERILRHLILYIHPVRLVRPIML